MQGVPIKHHDVTNQFPAWALLPKRETGVENLISKFNTYDGRGVVIAVFDSGIDPFASGMQTTADGKTKIIDRIDASGSGDVDTSTVVKAANGCITGLTGKKLVIPSDWINPTKEYHIGVKCAYSFYPLQLCERIIKQKKEKDFDPFYKTTLAEAQRDAQSLDAAYKSNVNGIVSNGSSKNSPDNESISSDERFNDSNDSTSYPIDHCIKMQKDDAAHKVAMLKHIEKKFCDDGPSYDCVVYHDGKIWWACIDTSECGDLSAGVHLGEYCKDFSCKYLTKKDQLTVSINVYNNGNLLEIVGMCSSHGTHVASIASANFPDCPVKNGVAPGAQIVSIQLGDSRLGSMETGTALMRAMIRVMENPDYKVDVINMSYGEHGHWSHAGRIGEIANLVVNKYGVIWVSSAGNHGPALSTVGVPPDFFCDSVIGVGAYVSPELMSAGHAMMEKVPGCPYTWSSRGPTADGGRGVSVCAPGGAITSVPHFTLKKNMLINGTSMSSPHVAGCVALLVSALKQKDIPYSPYSIRRAIQNTALNLDVDVFAQGHGLIQVHKALDFLLENKDNSTVDNNMDYIVDCGKDRKKGIYLRNWDADKEVDVVVSVEPMILDDSRADPQDKTNFNMEFILNCDATWVRYPPCLQMSYSTRVFKVSIDPKGLKRGDAYFTSIKAFSAEHPEKGAYFEIPITVIVPHLNLHLNSEFNRPPEHFCSAKVRRTFLNVPLDASYAKITLKSSNTEKNQRFTIHTVQQNPYSSITTYEFNKILSFGSNEATTIYIAVQGGLTLEVCIARFWNCLANGYLEMNIEFHSVAVSEKQITFATSDGVHRVDVRVNHKSEELFPQASLKHLAMVLQPSESRLEVLGGQRDTIPEGRPIYQTILTYNLTMPKSGIEVSPRCVLLNEVLYEGAYESQLWMIFDHKKQLIFTGDAFCKKYCIKLEKGDYVIRLHIRHEKSELLEKLNDLPMTIYLKLSQELKLDVFSSYNAAVTGGRKAQACTLSPGSFQPYYITPPNLQDKILKPLNVTPGCWLVGVMTFVKDEIIRKAVSFHKFGAIRNKPDNYDLKIYITEATCKKKNAGTSSAAPEEKKDLKSYADYEEALKEFQASWIPKLDLDSMENLFENATRRTSTGESLPLNLARLQALDNDGKENRPESILVSSNIIDAIDEETVLAYYGTKADMRSDAGKIKSQMDRQKNILLEALARHGNGLISEIADSKSENRMSIEKLHPIDNVAKACMKFVDATDSKVINFFCNYYNLRGFHALSLRLVSKMWEDKATKESEEKYVETLKNLKWSFVVHYLERSHFTRFPPNYNPF